MKIIFRYLVVFILFSSCCKDDSVCTIDITNKAFSIEEVYGCNNTITELVINSDTNSFFITNMNEYNNLISGDCHPQIDFEEYNLLIGKTFSLNKINSFEYTFYETCESGIYKLYLKPIKEVNSNLERFYTYHLLIPKNIEILYLKTSFVN